MTDKAKDIEVAEFALIMMAVMAGAFGVFLIFLACVVYQGNNREQESLTLRDNKLLIKCKEERTIWLGL